MENTTSESDDPSVTFSDGLAPSLRGRRNLFAALVLGKITAMCGLMIATLSRQWHSFTQRGLAIKHVQLTIEI